MPHQCTNCGHTFPDGSKEMLSGCPDCGHNTFQYIPEGADPDPVAETEAEPPEPPVDEDSVTGRVTRAASTVKEYVRSHEDRRPEETTETSRAASSGTPTQSADAGSGPEEESEPDEEEKSPEREDRAQASARGEVADFSPLHSSTDAADTDREEEPEPTESPPPGAEDARVVEKPEPAMDTDLEELRAELNDQFESIRIVEPGQYELNLMELYDREEHIVALQEDGKYVIEVPESWRDGE
ncbi:MAG: OapC/ArvC family zinc-ribbon domain-containing protein [Halodesulfurarchaeum sp.]